MRYMTPYTNTPERSAQFGTINNQESMTQQSDAAETDINVIVQRFTQGQLPQVLMEPLYGDFTDVPDYKTAVEMVKAAEEAFLTIPAKVRREFDNDPQKFIEFSLDPNNKDKLKEWGLTRPEQPAETTLADINKTLQGLQPKENDNGSENTDGHRGRTRSREQQQDR